MTAEPSPHNIDRYEHLLDAARKIRGVSLWQDAWKRLRRNKVAMVALTFLIGLTLLALLTPLLPLQSPIRSDLKYRQFLSPHITAKGAFGAEKLEAVPEGSRRVSLSLSETLNQIAKAKNDGADAEKLEALNQAYTNEVRESWNNPGPITRAMIRTRVAIFGDWCVPSLFGTDHLGRDLLSRVMWGARVSIMVGIVATLVSLVIGVSYGATAGFLGGWIDNLMMRFVDVLYSIPFIFVVIFIITVLSEESIKRKLEGYGINQIMVFFILIGAIYWLTMSRVVRGQVISLKNEQFIEAARTIGAGTPRIIFQHLVPNVLSIVIVYLTLTIPAVMLFEAFLSFLGLGVSPPDVSWGLLANEGVKVLTTSNENIYQSPIFWWIALFPGLMLAATLFALNFLGDGLRDALDPRMKNR